MTSRFASLTEQGIEKVVEDKDSQTQKGLRRWQRSCLLITWKRRNWENLRKRKSCTNFENFLCRSEKERIRSMYNKRVITIKRLRVTSVMVISRSRRLITVSSNTRPNSQLTGTTLNGREEGGQYHISQTYEQERFEARKVVFSWECLNIFATGCSSIG